MSATTRQRATDEGRRDCAPSELTTALARCRHAFLGIGLISGMINLLTLTGSLFMLEIYDRVLPSRSVPTLVGLAAIAFSLYAFQGVLDVLRGRVLVRVGISLDETLIRRVFDLVVRLPLSAKPEGDGLQPVRDLDRVRGFLSGLGPTALFDLPWMPLYIAICFLFHPWIGATALVGALLLVSLTFVTELRARKPTRAAVKAGAVRTALAEASRRNAEVLQAMGMGTRMASLWGDANASYMTLQQRASDVAGGLGAVSKVMRLALQSSVLAVGAYLVIEQQATAGVMIASSILISRALAPVELAIANWRGFIAARQSWKRLTALFAAHPARVAPMALPCPASTFAVENITAGPPGTARTVVHDVTFSLKAGNAVGIIGASASGKSSLARLLVGVWKPASGTVRLDGAALEQWDPDALGSHIGYLPQLVELFSGTIAENISRFDPAPDPEAVIAAARAARVHEMILHLPDGYETADRRRRRRTFRRAEAARRACACPLSRPVPPRPRRAQFQPRRAGRAGADASDPGRPRAGSRRHRHRTPPERARGGRFSPRDGGRTGPGLRPEGRSDEAGASPARRGGAQRRRPESRRKQWSRIVTKSMPHAQKSIRRHLLASLAIVAILAGGVGGVASTTELSGAVIAPGSVVVDSNVKKVQHPTGGIVGELRVRDGDRVKAGDIVVRLDETITQANLAIVAKGLDELRARLSRLEAERDDAAAVIFPAELSGHASDADVARTIDGEKSLFAFRRTARAGQKAQLKERIVQLKEEVQGLAGQIAAKRRENELITLELEAVRDLWRKNLVPIQRVTALERDAARLEGERGQLVAATAQAKGRTSEIELQILQIDQDLRTEVAKEIPEVQGKIAEFVERKVAAEDQLRRIDIRAPQDGMVHQSVVHTVGGVVGAGETIMLIVPAADLLTVEAKLSPQDIDQVHAGQGAGLRFSAFNQRTTPELDGVVSRVSADLTADPRTGAAYYLVRIALPEAELAKLGDLHLIPGMPVEAFIRTGERTILSYLTKPFADQAMRAFRAP